MVVAVGVGLNAAGRSRKPPLARAGTTRVPKMKMAATRIASKTNRLAPASRKPRASRTWMPRASQYILILLNQPGWSSSMEQRLSGFCRSRAVSISRRT